MYLKRVRLVPLVVVAVAVGGLASGCGDSEGDNGDSGQVVSIDETAPAQPAKGSPEEFAATAMEQVAAAKEKRQCGAVNATNKRSTYDFDCPADPSVRKSLKSFEILKSDTYDTAAVVDYSSGNSPSGATMLLYQTPDGKWAIGRFGLLNITDRQSDEKSREGLDEAVDSFLTAIRKRDCSEFGSVSVSSSNDTKTVCSKLFPETLPLARDLKANPTAEPDYLGGNSKLGFYGLTTEEPEPRYLTISVVETNPSSVNRYQILDVAPGPVEQ
jgi:hypothetical protein